jgi:hypothetical protein
MEFKVGDKVRVLPCVEEDVRKRGWDPEMLSSIGRIGTITSFCCSDKIRITFNGENYQYGYYFYTKHLEHLEELRSINMNSILEEEQIILNQNN